MANLAVWICGIAVVLTVLNMIAGWFNNDQDHGQGIHQLPQVRGTHRAGRHLRHQDPGRACRGATGTHPFPLFFRLGGLLS